MTDTAPTRRGLWRWSPKVGRGLIIGLGVISPVAVFAVLRITASRTCANGVNMLALPWHPALSTAVLILAVLVALGSLTMIVFGYGTRGLRADAIAMTVWGVLSVIPVALVLFITTFGDPGPECGL